MSYFYRRISDVSALKTAIGNNIFLAKANTELVESGQALLAVRNCEATIYYNGNQLCNMAEADGYEPAIYNHYLPIVRSRTLEAQLQKKNYREETWQQRAGLSSTFSDVYCEVLDNIRKESAPESVQASRFYRFSPLNRMESHEIVLLDIEAAFSAKKGESGRIDLVFYHTGEQRLMFVEVKRLNDPRLYNKRDANGNEIEDTAEVLRQMDGYRKLLSSRQPEIRTQYNNVIDCYNALGGCSLPHIGEAEPLLGLLLVEFTRKAEDQEQKGRVQKMLAGNGIRMYAVGDTSRTAKDSTIAAVYKRFS